MRGSSSNASLKRSIPSSANAASSCPAANVSASPSPARFSPDPQLLILDEATSNLDTESEQLIQQSLNELFKGRTTFVIAHRLSTITHADVIVAIDAGRIVETGTHEALMAEGGFYAAMVDRQRESLGLGATI